MTWQISGVAAWFFPKDQVQFQSALANLMEPDEPVVSLDVLTLAAELLTSVP